MLTPQPDGPELDTQLTAFFGLDQRDEHVGLDEVVSPGDVEDMWRLLIGWSGPLFISEQEGDIVCVVSRSEIFAAATPARAVTIDFSAWQGLAGARHLYRICRQAADSIL